MAHAKQLLHRIRALAISMMLRLIAYRRGEEAAAFWYWELTPMPLGPPSLSQYVDGLILAMRKPHPRHLRKHLEK